MPLEPGNVASLAQPRHYPLNMPAYLIARVKVNDWERYRQYTQRTPAAVAKYGGKFLVRGGAVLPLEGPTEERRVVVIEFPNLAQIKTFYESPEYQQARQFRIGAAEGEFIAVEGIT